MKKKVILSLVLLLSVLSLFSFKDDAPDSAYTDLYYETLQSFKSKQNELAAVILKADPNKEQDWLTIQKYIQAARNEMKVMDFWFRYLDPLAYKKINSPLPVEWETEVFEKFEKPYKREGAGLTLAALYMEEDGFVKDTLLSLISQSIEASEAYNADSITRYLSSYHHFFLCNRLFLLNTAAIYTTGFECPNTAEVIPELRIMMAGVNRIYQVYNKSFPATPLSNEYTALYEQAVKFVAAQPADYSSFDHFSFIKDYINPLYILNQKMINQYKVATRSMVDYALNKKAASIFDKGLYTGQNSKGVFHRVRDEQALAELDKLGKMLFYDPILSGNNLRSCASCHKPTEYFTDTVNEAAFQFNHSGFLPRNTPSLINAEYNHLVMQDGKHFTLQHQIKGVITNPLEMGASEEEILKKLLSCKEYKEGFERLLKYTPADPQISFEHITSAITFYYSKFSKYYAPFDQAMHGKRTLTADEKEGFNIFMSKAQCATCHFVPQFNGVKPPYIGSEFEVLGVPADKQYKKLSDDAGRYTINPAEETMHAFRTGTVRNSAHTMPYMHNGVFNTMEEVIDFYDGGGGAGRGLNVPNQTLPSDSLRLTKDDKRKLIAFINSLNEEIIFEPAPAKLPKSSFQALNSRKVGGEY